MQRECASIFIQMDLNLIAETLETGGVPLVRRESDRQFLNEALELRVNGKIDRVHYSFFLRTTAFVFHI